MTTDHPTPAEVAAQAADPNPAKPARYTVEDAIAELPDVDQAERDRAAAFAILKTFGSMPYAGICHFSWPSVERQPYAPASAAPTFADVLANLERLRKVLAGVAERNQETADELRALKRNLAGARELADTINRYADLEDRK